LVAFVCLLLHLNQGEAECGMIELAVVGLPPPEQGSLFFNHLFATSPLFFLVLGENEGFTLKTIKWFPLTLHQKKITNMTITGYF